MPVILQQKLFNYYASAVNTEPNHYTNATTNFMCSYGLPSLSKSRFTLISIEAYIIKEVMTDGFHNYPYYM